MSRHIKREKASLPVDVRCSKTSLLKLPNELLSIYLFIYLFIYLQYLFRTYLFLFQETVSISSLEFETALYPLILESSGAYEPQYRKGNMTSIINIIYEHNYFYLFIIIFIFFFQLPIYLICLNRFSLLAHFIFEHYLSIKFTTTRLYYLNCNDFPILY